MKPADVCEKIENWLRAKVDEAGASGVVIGMSGGIDSSVTAALAKRALGGRKVLGLILPCDSNPKDAETAKALAKKFGISVQESDLTYAYNDMRKTLAATDTKALGNIKARLRMAALYYFANVGNYLVLGTSNKSEIATGYFTKHGDAACDLSPIGGLYKTQVFELAKHLEIPKEIIEATPTAGLWEGQTDEQEIGMSYAALDAILRTAERNKDVGADRKKIERVMELVKKSVHKRQLPEVCRI